MKRVLVLGVFLSVLEASAAEPPPLAASGRFRPRLSLVDVPFTFRGGVPSMQQSLEVSHLMMEGGSWGIDLLGERLEQWTQSPWLRYLVEVPLLVLWDGSRATCTSTRTCRRGWGWRRRCRAHRIIPSACNSWPALEGAAGCDMHGWRLGTPGHLFSLERDSARRGPMQSRSMGWRTIMGVLLLGTGCQIQTSQPPEQPAAPGERVVVVQGRAQASQQRSDSALREAEEARKEAEQAKDQAELARTQSEQTRVELADAERAAREAEARAQQERTREAQEEAREAREAAQRAQAEAERQQREVETARREAQEAQARSQQEVAEANAAKKQAEEDKRRAEEQARAAQEAQKQQPEPSRQAQTAPAEKSPAPAPTRTVTGQLVDAGSEVLIVRAPNDPGLRLEVGPDTQVLLDGRRSFPEQLPEGSQVRASYREDEGGSVAVRVDATSPKPATPAEDVKAAPEKEPQPDAAAEPR